MMVQIHLHGLCLTLLVVCLQVSAEDFEDLFIKSITGETDLFVGDNLNLNCSLNESLLGNFTASNITFKFEYKAQGGFKCVPQSHVTVVDIQVAMLVIQNVTSENQGPYACYVGSTKCTDGNNSNVIFVDASGDVTVEYTPHNVTNFQCEIYNWYAYMICTWQHPVNYTNWSNIEVLIKYMLSGHPELAYSCSHPNKNNCTWNKEDVNLSNSYYIRVAVKNLIHNVTASTIFTVNTSAIVKPAPVQNFSIAASKEESGCLVLSWWHSDKVNDKIYRIKHQNTTDKSFYVLGNVTVTNFNTCGYLPYTNHHFSVECYPVGLYSGYWSEPVNASFRTPMTAPDFGPQAKNGSFVTTNCVSESRNITLMWQEVEAAARNGLIDGYLVKIDNNIVSNVSADMHSANILLPCNLLSHVDIFAHNEGGYSRKPTVLLIPPVTFTVPVEMQESFSVNVTPNYDSSEHRGTYRAMWEVSAKATNMNYTFFWCMGSPGKPCMGLLQWSNVISGTDTYYDFHLPNSDVESNIYGISVTDSDRGMSSGIFWTGCLFSHNLFMSRHKTVEDLKVEADVEKAKVFWSKIQCTYQSLTKVTGYKIKWCKTGRCNDIDGVSSFDVPATANMYTASALTADVKYSFTVQPVSYKDVGDEVKPWVNVIPDASENQAWIVPVFVTVCVAVFVLLLGAFVYRKCKMSRAKTKSLVPEHFLTLACPEPVAPICVTLMPNLDRRQAAVRLLGARSNSNISLSELCQDNRQDIPQDNRQDIPQGINSQEITTNPFTLDSDNQQNAADQETLHSHSESTQPYHNIKFSPTNQLLELRNGCQNEDNEMCQVSEPVYSETGQMLTDTPTSQSSDVTHQDDRNNQGSLPFNCGSLNNYHQVAHCQSSLSPESKCVIYQDGRHDQGSVLSNSSSLQSYHNIAYCESNQSNTSADVYDVNHQHEKSNHETVPSNSGSIQTDLSYMFDHQDGYLPNTVIPTSHRTVSHFQYENGSPANKKIDENHSIGISMSVESNRPESALTQDKHGMYAKQGHITVDLDPSAIAETEFNGSDVALADASTSLDATDTTLVCMQNSNGCVAHASKAAQYSSGTSSSRSSFNDSQNTNDSSNVPTDYIQMNTFTSSCSNTSSNGSS